MELIYLSVIDVQTFVTVILCNYTKVIYVGEKLGVLFFLFCSLN